MKFCRQCGKTLSIIGSHDPLCNACEKSSIPPPNAAQEAAYGNIDLRSATLCLVDGKIVLQSEEGWLLWSGSADGSHPLHLVISRAERILSIRKKKKK